MENPEETKKMQQRLLDNNLLILSNFRFQTHFGDQSENPFSAKKKVISHIKDNDKNANEHMDQLKSIVSRSPLSDPMGQNTTSEAPNSNHKPVLDKLDIGINLNGVNCLYGLLTNPPSKQKFLNEKYDFLKYSLHNSCLFRVENSYSVPFCQSNIAEFQGKIQFTEMNRIFFSNYCKQDRHTLLVLLEEQAPFPLSEIGSVFGIKNQKSLIGFINEKNGVFYLESPEMEVKLDLVYCRFSHGYIMKGSFVAVTGVLRGTKFTVFEMVIPQSGFFLEPDFKDLTDQK